VACWRRSFLEEKLVEGKGARIAEREARRKKRRRRWSENASAREREREREREAEEILNSLRISRRCYIMQSAQCRQSDRMRGGNGQKVDERPMIKMRKERRLG